jgi:endoglucanase
VRGNFSDIPLLIGEWDINQVAEPAARWKYFDYLVRTAAKYNTSTCLWDNGSDQLDRNTHTWRDPTAIDIYMHAVAGVSNSLADSTEDGSATTQTTSAYIWNQVGSAPAAQTLPFILNGNTVKSLSVAGKALTSGSDYSVSGSNIAFTTSFLSKYVSASAAPGIKANVTVAFSAGASLILQVVQWDVPTLSQTTSAADSSADLYIPVTWKGVPKVAAVRMLAEDGTYPVDDWTVYLGPLQQARSVSRVFRFVCQTRSIGLDGG